MLFNSIDFVIFLPVVLALYWFVFNKNLKHQNLLIVVSSYVFYGMWDWRFLSIILLSTVVDYFVSLALVQHEEKRKRKLILLASILVNLGALGFFKYYNFFIENFVTAFSFFGRDISPNSLDIILPVGISFYTFQTLSYTIDVYRKKLEPTKDFIAFAAFVSFFPQLVAGPIERAINLLPQFRVPRTLDNLKAIEGLRQILWGLFKKIVIADNCAIHANAIFNDPGAYSGATLFLGGVFFAFQIYCDFSGYSDIAIGTARLFGFQLMRNFAYPYFSRNIAEFWRRWHISLSSWFRDYVYIPLGGSQGSSFKKVRNVFIIFLVSGFWHGANWTFVIWGALNALYFLPLLLTNSNRTNIDIVAKGKLLPSMKDVISIGVTFSLTVIAWIFFRAENLGAAWVYVRNMVVGLMNPSSYVQAFSYISTTVGFALIFFIVLLIVLEWLGREEKFPLERFGLSWAKPVRWSFYYYLVWVIFVYGAKEQEFIYFQF